MEPVRYVCLLEGVLEACPACRETLDGEAFAVALREVDLTVTAAADRWPRVVEGRLALKELSAT